MSDDHGMEWCHLKITRLEAEYEKLWQMYGDLEDKNDRLREALSWYARESTWIAKGGIVNAPIAYDGGERAATLLFALQEADA